MNPRRSGRRGGVGFSRAGSVCVWMWNTLKLRYFDVPNDRVRVHTYNTIRLPAAQHKEIYPLASAGRWCLVGLRHVSKKGMPSLCCRLLSPFSCSSLSTSRSTSRVQQYCLPFSFPPHDGRLPLRCSTTRGQERKEGIHFCAVSHTLLSAVNSPRRRNCTRFSERHFRGI